MPSSTTNAFGTIEWRAWLSRLGNKITWLILAAVLALGAWGGYHCCKDPDLVWTAIHLEAAPHRPEAHLLKINRHTHILIDSGHPQSAESLLHFLKAAGVTRLNALIISHSHRDHYGGLLALLDAGITVDALYFNPAPPFLVQREPANCAQAEIEAIQKAAQERRIPLINMTTNTQWVFKNGITLKVLYVYDGLRTPLGHTAINDTSAILLLTHHKIRMLFPGDLTQRLGAYITRQQSALSIQADLLKVPSAEGLPEQAFFEAVQPQALVVVAPAELWLSAPYQRLREMAAIPTYVTGQQGHIKIKSDGYKLKISAPRLKKAATRLKQRAGAGR